MEDDVSNRLCCDPYSLLLLLGSSPLYTFAPCRQQVLFGAWICQLFIIAFELHDGIIDR
jgi:hypothetical protein